MTCLEPNSTFVPVATGQVISMDRRQARAFFGLPPETLEEEEAAYARMGRYVQIVEPPSQEP